MSETRYHCTCVQCGKFYTAKKLGSKFCSGACRARYSREKKSKLVSGLVEVQSSVIKAQDQILEKIDKSIIDKSIIEVPKVRDQKIPKVIDEEEHLPRVRTFLESQLECGAGTSVIDQESWDKYVEHRKRLKDILPGT